LRGANKPNVVRNKQSSQELAPHLPPAEAWVETSGTDSVQTQGTSIREGFWRLSWRCAQSLRLMEVHRRQPGRLRCQIGGADELSSNTPAADDSIFARLALPLRPQCRGREYNSSRLTCHLKGESARAILSISRIPDEWLIVSPLR
jgi:hypothetical protein